MHAVLPRPSLILIYVALMKKGTSIDFLSLFSIFISVQSNGFHYNNFIILCSSLSSFSMPWSHCHLTTSPLVPQQNISHVFYCSLPVLNISFLLHGLHFNFITYILWHTYIYVLAHLCINTNTHNKIIDNKHKL